jgi:hypothetical protein
MKIYKAVAPYYLEQATKEGWALEQTLPTSRYDKVECDTPISLFPKRDDNYNSMQYTNCRREELVQVNEPIFIVSKESEVISREEELMKLLSEANDKVKLADQRNANDTRDIKTQTGKIEGLESDLSNLRGTLTTEQTARRQMETHLAKIRTAIGTVRYDEILAP